MQSALSFIFVLGVLVVVHEYGHYLMARMLGIRAEKFSIGFGPKIFAKKVGETEFCVSLLPLGGFVKLAGESAEDARGEVWEFHNRPLLHRTLVVLAGPLMNALLAYLLFFFIFLSGQPTLTSTIGKVLPDTPAARAGLLEGDKILEISGQTVTTWEEVLAAVRGKTSGLMIKVKRSGQTVDLPIQPIQKESKNVFGKTVRNAFLGIAPANEIVHIKSSFGEALWMALVRLWTLTSMIFISLGMMFTGAIAFKDSMTGPIGIFFMTQQAAEMGISYLLYFMGSLSVSLFVLNLLPIPVLDGGHLLFMFFEKLKGKPLSEAVREKMTQGGMVLLLGLMAFVILQDVSRFSILDNVLRFFQHK